MIRELRTHTVYVGASHANRTSKEFLVLYSPRVARVSYELVQTNTRSQMIRGWRSVYIIVEGLTTALDFAPSV